jgi:tRNA(Ile)-lysidine synthase
MLSKLYSALSRYEMLKRGDTLIVAVSGGADSVALLFGMYLLKKKLGINLEAVHFNHQLRGEESDKDEAFVRSLCDQYDIPLHVGTGLVKAGEKGLEAAARDARYAFFATLPGKIATAHTADDNAETVLMHLVRGTGLKGLGGIAPVRANLIRPMLDVTRAEVLAFLDEYHLSYVTDSSNETDAFLRNRLRHHVMPWLMSENPKFAENTSVMAQQLRLDEDALEKLSAPGVYLQVNELRRLAPPIRSRVLCGFLKGNGVKEPERSHIALLEQLVFSERPSARAEFPGGIIITREYNILKSADTSDELTPVKLPRKGIVELPQIGLRIICGDALTQTNRADCFSVVPNGEMTVRGRESGDTMRLAGGSKSLKKLFIDRKIPAAQRNLIPVVADENGVLGVYGIGANCDRLGRGIEICFESMAQCQTDRNTEE